MSDKEAKNVGAIGCTMYGNSKAIGVVHGNLETHNVHHNRTTNMRDNKGNMSVGDHAVNTQTIHKQAPDVLTEVKEEAPTGECYRMQSNPRGLCYIFSNKDFGDDDDKIRLGAEHDRDAMKQVFSDLKFKVTVLENSEADDMDSMLKILSQKNHSNYDCLVVVFLTHGEDGGLQGSDNNWIYISTFTDYFKPDNCPSLANKPKLFFFQSCRGSDHQKGHTLQADGPKDADGADVGKEISQIIAPEADFFFAYATVPGKQALRNSETGSWFIQELKKTFQENAHSQNLLQMMTTVKREVDKRKIEFKDGSHGKQTAEETNRLLKTLYFLPTDAQN